MTVEEERRSSTLKRKEIPFLMEEVHTNCDQNRINLCPSTGGGGAPRWHQVEGAPS